VAAVRCLFVFRAMKEERMNPVKRKIEERLSPCLEWIFSEPEEIEARVEAAAKAGLQQV